MKIDNLSGVELRQRGARLREKDKHFEALTYLTLAIATLQKENKYNDLIDALRDRCLTWKHLFILSKNKSCAIFALKDAEAMLEVSKEYELKNKYHTSYFRLGEVAMLYEEFKKAVSNFKKAIKYYQGPLAEKGDYRYHLGEAAYRNGNRDKGKKFIMKGLDGIRKGAGEVNPFLAHVWETGALMKLSELNYEDDQSESLKYLKEAEIIAKSDKDLVIRRRQIAELMKKFLT